MTPLPDSERWQRIEAILDQVLAVPVVDRAAVVDSACGEDAALKAEVESFLAAGEKGEDFLDATAGEFAGPLLEELAREGPQRKSLDFEGRRVGPYNVIREVGSGGMGVVYEAEDTRLGRRVALKFLPPGYSRDPVAKDRFLREAQAASALDHPNICAVYDIGELADGRLYMVMPLYKGESLATRLGRGPLALGEALDVAIQVARALERAHEAGITHRDVKPANVIVTERGEVKLLDFGLAKMGDAAGLTQTGIIVGTPAYIAPEQVLGEPVDHRADIFSFGAMLYELLAGQRPFRGNSAAAVVHELAYSEPAPLAEVRPDLPPLLIEVTTKALAKKPEHRYSGLGEVVAILSSLDLAGGPAGASGSLPAGSAIGAAASAPHPRRRLFLALAVAAMAIAGAAAWWALRSSPGETPSPVQMRRSVAVLGFKNLSGLEETAWLSTGFAEMLTAELAAGQRLRSIAGENVARAKVELALGDGDTLAGDTLDKLRTLLGADLVVLGSYLGAADPGGAVRLILNVQDAGAGSTVATLSETGTMVDILDLVSRMGSRLRQELGIDDVTPAAAVQARARLPANPEAIRRYSEGLERLRAYDFASARDLLERAIEADPEHPLAHAALAEVWSAMGYDTRAAEEAAIAVTLSTGLSREERLFVEGRDHEMSRRWQQAIESYRTLYDFFPDNIDYGLRLTGVLAEAGRGSEAFGVIQSLRELPPPTSQDVRIELAEAAAANAVSDHRRVLAAAAAAVRKGEAQGARLLVARARLLEAWALVRLGDAERADRAVEAAVPVFAAAGDLVGETDSINLKAGMAFERGDFTAAQAIFGEMLGKATQLGDQKGIARALNALASCRRNVGDSAGARKLYREALAVVSESDDRFTEGLVHINLAILAVSEGDLGEARAEAELALERSREIGYDYAANSAVEVLGEILLAGGDVAAARSALEEALAGWRAAEDPRYLSHTLFDLGRLELAVGDPAAARARHEEALRLRTGLGDELLIAESRTELALLAIEEGRAEAALELLGQATEHFRDRRDVDNEAYATAASIAALEALDRVDEARAAAARARELAPACQALGTRLWVSLRVAGRRIVDGELEAGAAALRVSRDRATELGLVPLALEARLALAALAAEPGDPAAVEELRAVAAAAREKGLLRLARQAEAAFAAAA